MTMGKIREWVWRISGADTEITKWKNMISDIYTQMADLKSIKLQMEAEIAQLKAEPAKLKEEKEKAEGERDEAKQKVEELTTRCNQLQGKLDSRDRVHEFEKKTLQERIEKMMHAVNSANGRLGAYVRHTKGYA